jgi:glycosyltransferase involved in cell wall biosynthesis
MSERLGLHYSVVFTGRIQPARLRPLIDEAQVVVAPHIWIEPFGRTVVEAMARGKVTVAARRGGPAETITDGETGFLFTPGSTESLQKVLGDALLLAQPQRQKIGEAARNWVAAKLSPDAIAQQHEEFYRSVIGS